MLPVAHVSPADRYLVTKVHTIDGFYGVTYHLGFRDEFDVSVNAIIDLICDIEQRLDPRGCASVIKEVRAVANSPTHMYVFSEPNFWRRI